MGNKAVGNDEPWFGHSYLKQEQATSVETDRMWHGKSSLNYGQEAITAQ